MTIRFADLPAIGAPLEAGTFAGVITHTNGKHCAVVLLADKPAEELPWKKAIAWAEEIKAMLPTRLIAALLFAHLRDRFERHWHWTCEPVDGSYAWEQDFNDGTQNDFRLKCYEGRARAVRLIEVTP